MEGGGGGSKTWMNQKIKSLLGDFRTEYYLHVVKEKLTFLADAVDPPLPPKKSIFSDGLTCPLK